MPQILQVGNKGNPVNSHGLYGLCLVYLQYLGHPQVDAPKVFDVRNCWVQADLIKQSCPIFFVCWKPVDTGFPCLFLFLLASPLSQHLRLLLV